MRFKFLSKVMETSYEEDGGADGRRLCDRTSRVKESKRCLSLAARTVIVRYTSSLRI